MLSCWVSPLSTSPPLLKGAQGLVPRPRARALRLCSWGGRWGPNTCDGLERVSRSRIPAVSALLFVLVCLSVRLCLCLWWVFVHPSAFGNCGSSLLVACSVPSQGLQPGGDAQEDPPSAGPSPRDCRASAPAPPGDPMTGVCLEDKPNTRADWGSGRWNIVRGSGSSLPPAVEPVFCPGIPGGGLERGPSILEAGGEHSPHFFPSVVPISSLYSAHPGKLGEINSWGP